MREPAKLLILLMFAASLSGCIGTNIPSWGKGNGDYYVSWDGNYSSQVMVKSPLWEISEYESTDPLIKREYMNPWGCKTKQITEGNDTWSEANFVEGGVEATSSASPITLSGWLYATKHFPDGAQDTSPESNLASTAIVMTTGDYEEVSEFTFEDVDKVGIKDWFSPTAATTTPKLDSGSWTKEGHHKAGEINNHHEEGFANVGLIPSTSNVMYGFRGLEEGRIPVNLEGFILTSYQFGPDEDYTLQLDEECRIVTSMKEGEAPLVSKFNLLVTKIQFEDGIITPQGNAANEWSFGDVPILGALGYTVGLIFVGAGGAMTAFIISMRMEHNRARRDAESLLTGEHLKAAKRIKKDIKEAKRKGYDYKQTEATKKMKKIEAQEQKAKTAKATQKIKSFDLDSVVESGPATYSIKGSELGGGGVMESEDSIRISSESEVKLEEEVIENNNFSQPMGGDSMLQSAVSSNEEPPKRSISRRDVAGKKSVSAKKGPPKRSLDTKPPPRAKREKKPSIQDDDFSDFSL